MSGGRPVGLVTIEPPRQLDEGIELATGQAHRGAAAYAHLRRRLGHPHENAEILRAAPAGRPPSARWSPRRARSWRWRDAQSGSCRLDNYLGLTGDPHVEALERFGSGLTGSRLLKRARAAAPSSSRSSLRWMADALVFTTGHLGGNRGGSWARATPWSSTPAITPGTVLLSRARAAASRHNRRRELEQNVWARERRRRRRPRGGGRRLLHGGRRRAPPADRRPLRRAARLMVDEARSGLGAAGTAERGGVGWTCAWAPSPSRWRPTVASPVRQRHRVPALRPFSSSRPPRCRHWAPRWPRCGSAAPRRGPSSSTSTSRRPPAI